MLNIPYGFKLNVEDFDSFRKELNIELYRLALNNLLEEYLVERFNLYNQEDSFKKNVEDMRERYESILVDIKKVEDTGIRNFMVPDVLTKVIYLKKDNIYYGIIDCDLPNSKDFFFNHQSVEHFTPNAVDISDEELTHIRNVWSDLLPSLINRSGDYFMLEDNIFTYPTFNNLIQLAKDIGYLDSSNFYQILISANVFDIRLAELEKETMKEHGVEILTYEMLNKRKIVQLMNQKKSFNEDYFKESLLEEFNLFKIKYNDFINFINNIYKGDN